MKQYRIVEAPSAVELEAAVETLLARDWAIAGDPVPVYDSGQLISWTCAMLRSLPEGSDRKKTE